MTQSAVSTGGELNYVTQYHPGGDRSITELVTQALAAVSGKDPLDLPPLYEAVDPDALELIVRQPESQPRQACFLGFSVDNWGVIVTGGGEIQVYSRT